MISARKGTDVTVKNLMVTLYSEALMVGKNKRNEEPTDEEVVGVIFNFIVQQVDLYNRQSCYLLFSPYMMQLGIAYSMMSPISKQLRLGILLAEDLESGSLPKPIWLCK